MNNTKIRFVFKFKLFFNRMQIYLKVPPPFFRFGTINEISLSNNSNTLLSFQKALNSQLPLKIRTKRVVTQPNLLLKIHS